jgi:ATP-dependent helicase HrpA
VPLATLNQVDERAAQWLVPGLIADKVVAVVKSLPQRLRRSLVPIADYAQGFLRRLEASGEAQRRSPLVQALIADMQGQGLRAPTPQDFQLEQVPGHLMMRFEVIDPHGRVLGASRSLAELRAQLGTQALTAFQSALAQAIGQAGDSKVQATAPPAKGSASIQPSAASAAPSQSWTFGALPELMEIEQAGAQLVGYPAIVPEGDGVVLQVFDDPRLAALQHELGLGRLFRLALKEALRQWTKSVASSNALALAYHPYGDAQALQEDLTVAVIKRCCFGDPWPRDEASFSERVAQARHRITPVGQELTRALQAILQEASAVQRKLGMLKAYPVALADIEAQLGWLLPKRFAASAPVQAWNHLPRYLKAIAMRIDKVREDPSRDAELQRSFSALQGQWAKRLQQSRGQDPRVVDFGWQLQELRVSLFAQTLKTPVPVSVKRLDKAWAALIQQLQ